MEFNSHFQIGFAFIAKQSERFFLLLPRLFLLAEMSGFFIQFFFALMRRQKMEFRFLGSSLFLFLWLLLLLLLARFGWNEIIRTGEKKLLLN